MYTPAKERYNIMEYNRCGRSGLLLPKISLGLWHNFGDASDYENMRQLCFTAFDNGITQFDLANNYGPAYGSAEKNFGRILKEDLMPYRDELIITTKAGFDMWEGPYGNWGSRKYLLASLDQSLKRMGLDYVDIFYHHRPDPNTPLEETVRALDGIVRSGKALYVGISNYNKEQTIAAAELFKELGTPFIINQRKYSMFVRDIEKDGLKDYAAAHGIGIRHTDSASRDFLQVSDQLLCRSSGCRLQGIRGSVESQKKKSWVKGEYVAHPLCRFHASVA